MGHRGLRWSFGVGALALCAACSALTPFGEFRAVRDGAHDGVGDGSPDVPSDTHVDSGNVDRDGSDGGDLDDVPVPNDALDAVAPLDGVDVVPWDIPPLDLPPPCPGGRQRCGELCVDLSSDSNHCGVCNNPCTSSHSTTMCVGGRCTIMACAPSYRDCNGVASDGCEVDVHTDTAHCGACNNACVYANATARCRTGTCALERCVEGAGDCNGLADDGCETDLMSSVEHCGRCGVSCGRPGAIAACVGGACGALACAPGYGNCDGNAANGCETNLLTDARHCGGCGMACPEGTTCAGGRCQHCPPNTADCNNDAADGCESSLAGPNNCGRCGNVCTLANATSQCSPGGMCAIAMCGRDFGNCDSNAANGCETNLLTDARHCGRCNNPCSAPHATTACRGGSCQIMGCLAGRADCNREVADGCETVLTNNPLHCGACNNRCETGFCRGTECVNFGGLVATADFPTCAAYSVPNPYTGNNGCAPGTIPTLYRRAIDCPSRSLTGASLYLCSNPSATTAYAGAYELVNCEGRRGVCIPNPYTNACSCPSGSSPMPPMGVYTDGPGCAGLHTGQMVFCYRDMRTAGFGGAWQLRDDGSCLVPNPLAGGCTCPPGYNAARIRVVTPPPVVYGAFIGICYR